MNLKTRNNEITKKEIVKRKAKVSSGLDMVIAVLVNRNEKPMILALMMANR